ncbi:hypothetical protein BELL_0015g00120 [Botrytis elliptica]|uniref:Uncharacterized protein n=1 Tax=Botrytis elliptica TaxID=278938 RepID=A0A4Z1K1R7_9HELO|nr:hypothetical protein BELL_0015g00120 [Botrytis elliptica]
MCDFGIPFVCIQCGTDQNPCHVKVVGPTLGFGVGVLSAYVGQPRSSSAAALRKWVKSRFSAFDSPSPIYHSSITSQANVRVMTTNDSAQIRMLGAPVDINGQVSNAIPF